MMPGKGPTFRFERNELKQPCVKDCPGRKAGCAVDCEKWAAYLEKRAELYEKRLRGVDSNHATDNTIKAQQRYLYRRKNYKGKGR